ncbi:MAG: hypothetical protein U0871_19485 [Gemmataceae bacterium]
MTPSAAPAPPRPAADVAAGVDLSDAARALLTPGLSDAAYFDALVKAGLYADGIRYTARLLSTPQAVWWGCLCVWDAAGKAVPPAEAAAVEAVVGWLRNPSDETRKACRSAARGAKATAPAALLANAAFLSGGNISTVDKPEVLAEPHLTGAFVANTVLAASRKGGAAGVAGRQRTYLTLAVDVYRGKNTPAGANGPTKEVGGRP